MDRVSQWTLATSLNRELLARIIEIVEMFWRDCGRSPTPEELAILLGKPPS